MKKGDTASGLVFHAGFPNAAEDRLTTGVSLDKLVIRHPASTFMWRLSDDGVPELGWQGGSLVVVDRALTPKQGSLLVVIVDEEFTIRRFHQKRLYLLNGAVETDEGASVWGVVTHVLQGYI